MAVTVSSKIIQQLKCSKRIEDVQNNFEVLVDQSKEKSRNKSSMSINVLVEIYKNLEKADWIKSIDIKLLNSAILLFSSYVECQNSNEYQNYVSSIYQIYKIILKKNIDENVSDKIFDCIFNNPKVKMVPKYTKFYWLMLADKILDIEKRKIKSLPDLLDNTLKFFKTTDIQQFCKNNLYWLIRKYFTLFNDLKPDILENAYEKIFECLVQIEDKNENPSQPLENTFKTFLLCLVQLIQFIISHNSKSKKSISYLFKLVQLIFRSKSEYVKIFNFFNAALPLFMDDKKIITLTHDKYIEKLIQSVHLVQNSCQKDECEEYISTMRTISSMCLNNWIKTSSEYDLQLTKSIFKLILFIAKSLETIKKQNTKCERCPFQSGIHDAIQLTTLARMFFIGSVKSQKDYSELISPFVEIYELQSYYIKLLMEHNCRNFNKLWDIIDKNFHSDAILLHSNGQLKDSLILFEAFFSNCLPLIVTNKDASINTLIRAYYNYAVCHLDNLNIKEALKYCYVSIALSSTLESQQNKTYMKCIVSAKSKAQEKKTCSGKLFKDSVNDEINCECHQMIEDFQKFNVYSSCLNTMQTSRELSKLLKTVNFGTLLIFELETYAELWFSTFPIVGVCKSLKDLFQSSKKEDKLEILISCGKAVTIISTVSNKLHNYELIEYVKFVTTLFESHINDLPKNANNEELLIRLLYGNTLRALYECTLLEKLQNEPPPSLSMVASDVRPHQQQHPDDACDVAPTHQSLKLSIEDEITGYILKAIDVWKNVVCYEGLEHNQFFDSKYKRYIEKTIEIMEISVQTLSLRGLDTHALHAADLAYQFANLMNDRITILRLVGFIVERVYIWNSELATLINKANSIVQDVFENDNLKSQEASFLDSAFEYLLNLSLHYFNTNFKDKALQVFACVHNKILHDYFIADTKRNIEDIKFSYSKLIFTQSYFINYSPFGKFNDSIKCISFLTNSVNAFVQCTNTVSSACRLNRQHAASLKMWIDCGLFAGKMALLTGLPRRARAVLRSLLITLQKLLLPRPTAEVLLLLARIDLDTEKYDDCKVKLDSLNYIMEENNNYTNFPTINNLKSKEECKKETLNEKYSCNENLKQFEMVLDASLDKYSHQNLGGSPIFQSPPFSMPSFIDHHRSCDCNKCTSINFFSLIFGINHLKSSLEYKTNGYGNALGFFEGTLQLLNFLKARLKYILEYHLDKFTHFPCENYQQNEFYKKFVQLETEFCIDASFYFVTVSNCSRAEKLNKQAMSLLLSLPYNNNLIMQKAYEQKLILENLKIDNKDKIGSLNMLVRDLEELQLTPTKLPPNSFKTPTNKAKLTIEIDRVKCKIGKNLNDSFDLEKPEFKRPTIKFDLDFDDNQECKQPKLVENVDKTPAPRIRNRKLLSEKNDLSQSKVPVSAKKSIKAEIGATSLLKAAKSSLIRSTSPGRLENYEPGEKKLSTRAKSTRIKSTKK